jgi:hypothetical protein
MGAHGRPRVVPCPAAMARLAVLLTFVALLVPAGAALAQDNPFGPLPPATPTPAPTPTPDTTTASQDTGTRTLYIIAGALLVSFFAIGVWIARDARRSIPRHDHHRGRHAMAEPVPGEPRERRRDPKAKAQSRKKTRAQRRARKHNRPRR